MFAGKLDNRAPAVLRAGRLKSSPEHWPAIIVLVRGEDAPEPDFSADGAEKKGMEKNCGEPSISVEMEVLDSPEKLVAEEKKLVMEFLLNFDKA